MTIFGPFFETLQKCMVRGNKKYSMFPSWYDPETFTHPRWVNWPPGELVRRDITQNTDVLGVSAHAYRSFLPAPQKSDR